MFKGFIQSFINLGLFIIKFINLFHTFINVFIILLGVQNVFIMK